MLRYRRSMSFEGHCHRYIHD